MSTQFRGDVASALVRGLVLFYILAVESPDAAWAQVRSPIFRDGDRIVMIGGTFIERLQWQDFLETWLIVASPDQRLTFRNLGWSGDNVFGESRALFGKPDDGFARLIQDVTDAKPTVVVVAYGANEANAGLPGLESFVNGLQRLLDSLSATNARIILVSGPPRESLTGRLPSQTKFNADLYEYNRAIESVAKERDCDWISLENLIGGDVVRAIHLTQDGLHLNPYGHWVLAPQIAQRLGVSVEPLILAVDYDSLSTSGRGEVGPLKRTLDGLEFDYAEPRLAYPATLKDGELTCFAPDEIRVITHGRLRLLGLPAGDYELLIDGKLARRATSADEWSSDQGVRYLNVAAARQWDELQLAVHEKNRLFFHRYRPQNETYLFLFRKHEQGNNALEIPQFDPLITAIEDRIEELRRPALRRFEVIRK